MTPDRTIHRVHYESAQLAYDVCDFCRYGSRRENLRRAVFVVADEHASKAAACAQHLGPMLEAIARESFNIHSPASCAVCETERQQRDSLLAEKRMQREAKKKQPAALTGETE